MGHYDRLVGLRPANRTAAVVVSAKGALSIGDKAFGQLHTDIPIATTPRPFWAADLAGEKFGRLTVIGFHSGTPGKGSVWVVRCVCGAYETRRWKTLMAALQSEHCVARCKACVRMRAIQLRGSSMKLKKPVSGSS